MAEVLGAVASAVQLVDVALRSSLKIYEFLSAIHNAAEDVKTLRDALQDVDCSMRTLRAYLVEFRNSKNTVQEHEVLPEIMTECLLKFHDDIQALHNILPQELTPRAANRFKWVFEKRKVKDITARLQDRKLSLVTSLSIVGLKHHLRLREDSANIAQRQVATHAAILDHLDDLHKAQEQTNLQLLHFQTTAKDQLSQQHDVVNANLTNRHNLTQSKLDTNLNKIQKVSNTVQAGLHKIYTTTRFSTLRSESATRVLRTQLLSEFRTMLDQVAAKSESQFETIRDRLESVAEQITEEFAQRAQNEQHMHKKHMDEHRIGLLKPTRAAHKVGNALEVGMKQSTEKSRRPSRYESQCTTATIHQSWTGQGRLGYLKVEVKTFSRRFDSSPHADTTYTIRIHFRPCQDLLPLRGISVSWSTAPDQRGFYQFGPSIMTFPIVPWLTMCTALYSVDTEGLQQLLVNGDLHLKAQDEKGWTLLHCAAFLKMPHICTFLVSHGLSWNQTDHDGQNPMHLALTDSFGLTSNLSYGTVSQFISGFSVSLDDLAAGVQSFHGFLISGSYLLLFEELGKYFLQNSENGWEYLFRWSLGWTSPISSAVDMLRFALLRGCDPDLVIHFPELPNYSTPLLASAVAGMRSALDMEHYRDGENTLETWCIVSMLIQGGANIHLVEAKYLEKAEKWYHVSTPYNEVNISKLGFEWGSALQECGLNPEEEWYKDIHIRKQAIRLRGASRTGIDEEILQLPSTSGLRHWKCMKTGKQEERHDPLVYHRAVKKVRRG